MTDQIEAAVVRAIATIRANFAEDITIDDLARAAMFSKFHFTRVFQRITGVSPGRYLSAVRMQEAKRLLTSTSLSIADISRRVGYHSVGTFSTRFTRCVGLAPTAYRQLGGRRPPPQASLDDAPGGEVGSAQGHIWPPPNHPGLIHIGLFPGRVPDGPPVRCTVLDRPGPFLLEKIPVGTYYLLCHVTDVTNRVSSDDDQEGQQSLAAGWSGPITVHAGQLTTPIDLHLRPLRPLDPPILLAVTTPP